MKTVGAPSPHVSPPHLSQHGPPPTSALVSSSGVGGGIHQISPFSMSSAHQMDLSSVADLTAAFSEHGDSMAMLGHPGSDDKLSVSHLHSHVNSVALFLNSSILLSLSVTDCQLSGCTSWNNIVSCFNEILSFSREFGRTITHVGPV